MGLYGPRLKLVRAIACRHRHAQVVVFGSLLLALVYKDRVRRRNYCRPFAHSYRLLLTYFFRFPGEHPGFIVRWFLVSRRFNMRLK